MIAIIDYGMGNLRSVQKALERVGADAHITDRAADIESAAKIVLPGVGAMAPAMDRLSSLGLIEPIQDCVQNDKPFLGICLGLQLLFEKSDEGGQTQGLGIIKGTVKKFTALKVPHMGWNQLNIKITDCPIYQGIDNNIETYFCHSYYVVPTDSTVTATTTDYATTFVSSICRSNLFGVQFHPEKSQTVGLKLLENFARLST